MLNVVDYEVIRRLHFKEHWSIKRLARELGHSRNTVRKALLEWDGSAPKYSLSKPRPKRTLTPELEDRVREILVRDQSVPRKQRHTAHQIHARLLAENPGIILGESTVRGLVRQERLKLRGATTVKVPLAFEPGEEAQIDFGEAEVIMAGESMRVQLFLMALCYSRRLFVMGFPRQNIEAFLEGHTQAFAYFGGVVRRGAYDNPKVAVLKILPTLERVENPRFAALRAFYNLDVRYCTPGKEGAHEKGIIERKVETFRKSCLVPVPEVADWDDLNRLLLDACDRHAQGRYPESKEYTIQEVFEAERVHLAALPAGPFPCCDVTSAVADGHARMRYDKSTYSVPAEFGRRRLEIRAFWGRVDFYHEQRLIASWPRSYTSRTELYDYRHYLKLLRESPGGCLNGKPYRGMPEVLLRYRRELVNRLERRSAARAMARVLLLLLEHPEAAVLEAVELALLSSTIDPQAVENLLHQMTALPTLAPPPMDLSDRPHLKRYRVPPPDLNVYDRLIGGMVP
jgi:transposase